MLVLTACSSSPTAPGASGGPSSGSPSATQTPAPALKIPASVPFDQPATFSVTNGRLVSALVKGHLHGTPLPGSV